MSASGPKTSNIMDMVTLLRSKNAGPIYFGFDIMFKDRKSYESGKKYVTKELISKLYGIQVDQVINIIPYDPGMGIKVTICRPAVSGDPEDTDIYGSQQHVPLMSIELPLE